jgi:hypothetical protein
MPSDAPEIGLFELWSIPSSGTLSKAFEGLPLFSLILQIMTKGF